MAQVAFDPPQRKNGNGSHGRREHELAVDLTNMIADLEAAEALRREHLHQIAEWRAEIYRNAKARGVTPTMLRAARALLRGDRHA